MPSPRTLILPENTQGRDFVVGDIHGAFNLLEQALIAVGFDPEKDRLIAVGDLVNRGPQSGDCLYYLAQPWFYALRGNHEEIFMDLYKEGELDRPGVHHYIPHGMGWMLEELNDTLNSIRSAFETLPFAIEVATPDGIIGFVHADVPAGMGWDTFKQKLDEGDKTAERTATWSRKRLQTNDTSGVDGISRVFFGHTVVDDGPQILDNCFFIDTGAVFGLKSASSRDDLYMTLIDIRATTENILNPVPTENALVRTATTRANKHPPPPEKPSTPHWPQ